MCLLPIDGALTGLSKKMIRQLYGEAQFKRWRRSYDERPPPISSFSAACEFMLLSA
jgi:bisphosphoglycerate-dependent phosphoglycerate mutase